jgi:hypothetical protein
MPYNLSEYTIRQKLRRYLDGKVTLREFRRWFVPATWDLKKDEASDRVRELVDDAKLFMAEYTGGYRTERDLRAKLSELFNMQVATSTIGNLPLHESLNTNTTTSSVMVIKPLNFAIAVRGSSDLIPSLVDPVQQESHSSSPSQLRFAEVCG